MIANTITRLFSNSNLGTKLATEDNILLQHSFTVLMYAFLMDGRYLAIVL
jgi:hypothetical protein